MSDEATAPLRNPLGTAGLVVVLVGIALPVLAFALGVVLSALEAPGGDVVGWAILGGLVFGGVAVGLAMPLAIVGGALCIAALTRTGRPKRRAVVGLVLGAVLAVLALPAVAFFIGIVA